MILTLTPPLTDVKGGIKYLHGFAMYLIPVKGEVKNANNFDSSFDARQRRSKASWLCTTLILHHVRSKVRSNMDISGDSSKNAQITCVFIIFLFQRLKMKACFLANMYFNERFSLDV